MMFNNYLPYKKNKDVKTKILSTLIMNFIYLAAIAQNGETAIIKKLNQEFLNAIIRKDSASLAEILADDFVLINSSGNRRTKADNLASLHVPGQQITGVTIDSEDLRMLTDNVGTITVWTTNHVTTGTQKITFAICYMDIYQKRNGKWKAVAAHVTSISQ
jgi:uncharacterized protein (TIGR02246 family)